MKNACILLKKKPNVTLDRGANAVFELCNLKIPTLFIPLSKKISRGDQIENVTYFRDKNASTLLFEENLTKESFVNAIFDLYNNKELYIKNLDRLNLNSSNQKIADILSSYI